MALDKDVLGQLLYNTRNFFSNRTYDDLIEEYGTIEAVRLAACKAEAETIIDHFKSAGVVNVTVATTGTATAQTGTGTGTIE